MTPFRPDPVHRIRIPPRHGAEHRLHPRQAHPPETVAAVRHLVETTRLPHHAIAQRTGIDKGTVSRWTQKHGWTRPVGACRSPQRATPRHVPVVIGRALAQRLRIQAERLVGEIEQAPAVDPAALAEALALLERARAEQMIRRSRRLRPPTPDEIASARAERDAARKATDEARRRDALEKYAIDTLPAQPAPDPNASPPYVWKWNRSESAKMGWKQRYARMRGEVR